MAHKAGNYVIQEIIKLWFDAIIKKYLKHCYFFEHHYNMNKSRFVIGNSQSSKTLINVCKKLN